MRKKLAGIHLLAPLSESDITDLSRNLDRELIINTTPVTDAVIDTYEKTNYIVTFEYDTTLDGGTNRIRRSIPTLELLGNTDANVSGTHWINLEDKDYHYIDNGATAQLAFEQLDEQLTKVCYLKHILDATGIGALVSSDDGGIPSSTVDDSEYAIVLGKDHTLTNANYSALYGGDTSELIGVTYSTILNGYNQTIDGSGGNVAIYGGSSNTITGTTIVSDVIINGFNNTMDGAVIESIIIGGHNNYIYKNAESSYGSVVIGSVYGYIEDGDFSTINNSANSYIYGGKYSGINLSSYIEIGDSTDVLVSISTNSSIGNSTFANIIASTYTTRNLTIYHATAVSIESSTNSYIWHSENASISASVDSSIGRYFLPDSVNSISKTTIRLGVSDVSDFNIGQLVTLTGAEFTSYTEEYRIYDIDVPNKFLYFVDKNNTQVNFNTSNSDPITIKILNITNNSTPIISNTNDTVVCTSTINTTADIYIVIGNSLNRYTAVSVSGDQYTTIIKLKLYGTDTIITNLTPNALTGQSLTTYYMYYNIDTSTISGCVNSNIYNGNSISVLSSDNGLVQSGSRGALIATIDSSMNYFSNTVIMGGTDHYVSGVTDAIIIGGNRNYIASTNQCNIIGGYDNKIIGASNCGIILGDNNYITSCGNVAIIACDGYTAQGRSNALITNSLTLVDRTLELTDNVPHAGDVLLVDYVTSGNIAKVKWGKSTESSGIPGLIETYTYTMWGISTMTADYISVEPEGSSPTTNYSGQTVGLTVDGFIYTDYLSNNYSLIRSNVGDGTGDGIDIVDGYTYVIKLQSIAAEWLGTCLNPNTPELSMSCSDTFVVVADASPTNNYTIHYKRASAGYTVNTLVSGDPAYSSIAVENIVSFSDITGSNISGTSSVYAPMMDAKFIRSNSSATGGKLVFYATNIAQTPSYAVGINAQYNNPGSGTMIIEWPAELDMPTSTSDFIWCKNYFDHTTWQKLYVSQILSGRQVMVGDGTNPDDTMRTCQMWYQKSGPRLSVSATATVTKISNAFAAGLA
jgi:hypothetical protein